MQDLTEQKYTAESTVRELRTRLEATEKVWEGRHSNIPFSNYIAKNSNEN